MSSVHSSCHSSEERYMYCISEEEYNSTPATSWGEHEFEQWKDWRSKSSCSIATYASTTASMVEDTCPAQTPSERPLVPNRYIWSYDHDEDDHYHTRRPLTLSRMVASARPASTKEFAALFPSQRKLIIHHDDMTMDGNMNLRVDTWTGLSDGCHSMKTLFHMRMRDLRKREFSLRRYSRESGREVCSSSSSSDAQLQQATETTGWKSSFGKMFSSFKARRNDTRWTTANRRTASRGNACSEAQLPQTIRLEFLNYARINMTCSGIMHSENRYGFEYWDCNYEWRQSTRTTHDGEKVDYALMRKGSKHVVARMVQLRLTQAEEYTEMLKGGWIPPYAMFLEDIALIEGSTDIAEAVVSTGMIALTDDWVRRRFDV